MTFAPRTVRNEWFRDEDGVMTKPVDEEQQYLDSVDLTDHLETNESVASVSFDDVSDVTLGTPSAVAGVVSYSHEGTGYAVLEAVLNFAAYLLSLGHEYLASAGCDVKITTAGGPGVGGAIGDAVTCDILDALSAPISGLDGMIVRAECASQVITTPLAWNAGTGTYDATLATTLDAADDGASATSAIVAPDPDLYEINYPVYSAKPGKTVRVPLRFVDPFNPTSDYTP